VNIFTNVEMHINKTFFKLNMYRELSYFNSGVFPGAFWSILADDMAVIFSLS